MNFGKKLKDIQNELSPMFLKQGNVFECSNFINKTKNIFKNEDCIIFTCGPSFGEHDIAYLLEQSKNKVVFCVKQTVNELKDVCDVHFFNCSNLPTKDYQYNENTFSIASSNYPINYRISGFSYQDFFMQVPLIEQIGGKENTIAFKKNFDDFLLSKTLSRNVGPGIMLETVLYFAVHFGVKSITTVGWDLDGHNSHYYKDEVKNKGCEIPWDMELNRKAKKDIEIWLKNKGIDLKSL